MTKDVSAFMSAIETAYMIFKDLSILLGFQVNIFKVSSATKCSTQLQMEKWLLKRFL